MKSLKYITAFTCIDLEKGLNTDNVMLKKDDAVSHNDRKCHV